MIGARVGVRVGVRVGAAVGVGSDPIAHSLVVDATSGKGVPVLQADWNAVFAAAGVSTKTLHSSWACNEASGNLIGIGGSAPFDLTAAGTAPTYEDSVDGWTRPAVTFADNTNGILSAGTGVGPDPTATSQLWLWFVQIDTIGADGRDILGIGADATGHMIKGLSASGGLRHRCKGTNEDLAAEDHTGVVRPYAIKHKVSATRINTLYTDLIVDDHASVADTITDMNKRIGDGPSVTAGMSFLLGACFSGDDGEWTDAEVHAVFTALGFPPEWSP